jgi:hypothetical protein
MAETRASRPASATIAEGWPETQTDKARRTRMAAADLRFMGVLLMAVS